MQDFQLRNLLVADEIFAHFVVIRMQLEPFE